MSLGISIVGGQTVIKRLKNGEELKGIFIKQVLEDSPAGKTNALKTGDKILEVSEAETMFYSKHLSQQKNHLGQLDVYSNCMALVVSICDPSVCIP